jgi:tartrate dehydratase alpha subunit/fumarate hydratase class I-like protein
MRMDDLIPGEVRKLRKLVLYAVQTSGCGACPPIRRCEANFLCGTRVVG